MGKKALIVRAIAAVFDEGDKTTSPELEGLFFVVWGLHHGAQYLMKLGGNDAGKLYAHPTIPGAAVQVPAAPFARLTLLGSPPHEAADRDAATASRLGDLGLGPRYFGRGVLPGRLSKLYPVSVRERIYGASIPQLVRDYSYRPEEENLVQGLFDRALARRLQVPALRHPANIWIGQTLADPRNRAYLVRAESVYADLDTPDDALRASYDSWKKSFEAEVDHLRAQVRESYMPMRGLK